MAANSACRRLSIRGVLHCLLGLTLLLSPTTAVSHRGHAVWTDITWAGEGFEITHRMHLADAIAVSRHLGFGGAMEGRRSMASVALYVAERFLILTADQPEVLTTLGAEIEDDFLFIYQEWSTTLPERFPAIENRILLDVEPDAQAFIKIIGPGLNEERERHRSE